MAYKSTLKDFNTGEVIYPQTLIDLVQDSDGTPASTLLENISTTKADKPKVLNVSLPTASWTGSGPYTQVVTISGGTANTKVDLQGDSSVIAQMINDGCNGLYISNTDGVFTAYAINNKPSVDLTVQVTLSEVTS